mmetsp:Transcript_96681/g.301613  ORF Transcript_96681/g.301613 Transcript_96681/m.301613 type:complete len:204 (-) Transcript_96681:127-738(-)
MPMNEPTDRVGRLSSAESTLAARSAWCMGSAARSYATLMAARSTASPNFSMRQFRGMGTMPLTVTLPSFSSSPRTSRATNSQPPTPGMTKMMAPCLRWGFRPVKTLRMAKEGRATMMMSAWGTASAASLETTSGLPRNSLTLLGSERSLTSTPPLPSTAARKRSASSMKSAKTVTLQPQETSSEEKTWAAFPAPQMQTVGSWP